MYKSIVLGLCLVFFVIGAVGVLSFVLLRAVLPDKKKKLHLVTFFDGNDKDCHVRISCILNIVTVTGLADRCVITAVDCGMKSDEKIRLFRAFYRERAVRICNKEEFFSLVPEIDGKSTDNGTHKGV